MKITPRAEITKEFVEKLRSIYAERLQYFKNKMEEQTNPHYKTLIFNQNKRVISKLIGLLNDPVAFDYEITRLRSLPYTKFEFRTNSRGAVYLCGLTSDIKIKWYSSSHKNVRFDGTYNFGPFNICIMRDLFTKDYIEKPELKQGYQFHFYPELDPMVCCRTPHHYARNTYYARGADGKISDASIEVKMPLDYFSSTCLGGFNEIVWRTLQEGDVVEALRTLALYVGIINPGSPLESTDIQSYKWAVPA